MTDIFDIITEEYDSWYDSEKGKPLYESELHCLESLIKDCLPPVLEVGVGTGRFAQCFPGAIGIDPAYNALRYAQRRGIRVVQATGEMLPFRNETFGTIFIMLTLCFVQKPLVVLSEVKRVLKREGSIVIGFIHKNSSWGTFYEEKKKNGHPVYGRAQFYTLEDVDKMLQQSGLFISKVKSTLLQPPDRPPMFEKPVDGFVEGAGFLCIEVKKSVKL
jgi:ubiquinone/menaquinone biosynthesis C-methylase UbiE